MKALLEKKLDTYGYKYSSAGDEIIVRLSFDQRVHIHCKENDKCLVESELTGWNFLSGIVNLTMKGALVYASIGLAVVTILLALLEISFNYSGFSLFLIFAAGWITSWTTYYTITFESFKKQVIGWVDQA